MRKRQPFKREVVCKYCGNKIIKSKSRFIPALKKAKSRWVYVDQDGTELHGDNHKICKSKDYRLRTVGRVGRENNPYVRFRKGYNSELTVKKFLTDKGLSVEQTVNGFGPDLIIDNRFTCEVKTVSVLNRLRNKTREVSFYVGGVTEKRKNDDIVSYVWPNNEIYFVDMKEHLSKCNRSGIRHVTSIMPEEMRKYAAELKVPKSV